MFVSVTEPVIVDPAAIVTLAPVAPADAAPDNASVPPVMVVGPV